MELKGTYRGFAPTDESGLGLGELEFVFDDEVISCRMATGLEIDSQQTSRSELRQMTAEELAEIFVEPADLSDFVAYTIGDTGEDPIFVLAKADPEETAAGVIIYRFFNEEVDAIFGPALLFTPEEVEAGNFDKAIEMIEPKQGDPGVVPRLANNGLRLEPARKES